MALIASTRRGWRPSGVILAGLHIGNGEVAAAALAGRGWPVHYLADDTAYDELFERFVAQRRAWGVEVIRWRNLREVYRVLRRRRDPRACSSTGATGRTASRSG